MVNALSLPGFLGGAPLQVHRLARELQRRGDAVAILSGARRPGQRALGMREEEYEGVTVSSLNTEPYIRFSDPRNYNNPPASAAVLAWLKAFRPDVVHAHSLQGLGAGWVDQAAAQWPLVVTMHDWWWLCARQFLVTEELRVDGPLVDYSTCACAGGPAFNQQRRAWLAQRLLSASVVLVPSAGMRDSLVANGIDPAVVIVDPNGVDVERTSKTEAHPSPPEGLPRLGFVGGADDVKGLPLLVEAVRRLGPNPPLRLTCWGAADSASARRPPSGIDFAPPYDPADTSRVMALLDALAVPSLMRESFSLVAHEALAAGVPVICGDNPGPAEVVVHGRNGLVVRDDTAASWAQALRRWAADPVLRAALGQGARGTRPALVSVAQQADHLSSVYQRLTGAPERPRATRRAASALGPPDLLLICGIEGAPLRYRAHHLVEAHRLLGGRARCIHYRDPAALELAAAGGLVIFYRVPWSDWVRRCLLAAREAGATAAFSVDDLVFDPTLRDRIPAIKILPRAEAELWMDGVQRYQQTALACGIFIGSTPALVEAARAQGLHAFLHPNGLGAEQAYLSQEALHASADSRAARRAEGICRVGYLSGSTTHDRDWALVEPQVAEVLERHGTAELWLLGPLALHGHLAEDHSRVRRVPFRPFQDLPRLSAELDVILAPLEPGLEFSEAKSAVKWLEAAAVGVPVIASPTGPFRAVIDDGVTGLLAEPDDWEDALEALVTDSDLRDRLGLSARRAVYRDHGPWAAARQWAKTWVALVEAGRSEAGRPAPAGPIEPPSPAALEPEAPGAYLDHAPAPRETVVECLGGDRGLGYRFTIVYPRLCRVDIYTALARSVEPGAPLLLELRGADGRVVRSGSLPASDLAEDAWTTWEFDPIADSAGRPFHLRLSQPGAVRNQGIACWTALDLGLREVDGRELPGALCVRAYSRPSRVEISAAALEGRAPMVVRQGSRAWRQLRLRYHRARIVYYKGRVSLRTRGLGPTLVRVGGYLRRNLAR